MIRILHIVHALSRGGGLTNFVMNYYRNIDREQIQFDFIYFKEVDDDFKDEITSLGGRYFKMQEPSSNLNFLKEREAFFKEHEGEYAAVHCHALFAAAVYAPTAKKYGVKNIIAHAHTNGYGVGKLRQIRNWLLIQSAKYHATHRMACSDDAAVFMFGKKAVENGRVTVISNAIDCKKYAFDPVIRAEVRKELGIPEKAFVIGHVGGFSVPKNHAFLMDAFHAVCSEESDAWLILAGGPSTVGISTMDAIKEKADAYGMAAQVHFLGIRRDVHRLMMAMDAFVFPSTFEGFGLVLVEAQATGLPCFASHAVPRSAKCTNRVMYLDLADGADVWAKHILKAVAGGSEDRKVDIDSFAQYNINEQKQILEDIYLKMQ